MNSLGGFVLDRLIDGYFINPEGNFRTSSSLYNTIITTHRHTHKSSTHRENMFKRSGVVMDTTVGLTKWVQCA